MATNSNGHPDGIWIGIDLGTSNSACAVWDSTRGSSKWMRLPKTVAFQQSNGKAGRIMPSVVRWKNQEDVLVGAAALMPLSQHDDDDNSSLLQSVKRLLGKSFEELDPKWLETLDFKVLPALTDNSDKANEQSVRLVARTGTQSTITTTPEEVLSVELEALRNASQAYLDRYRISKKLQVPGGCSVESSSGSNLASGGAPAPRIRNVIVGVPAHFSQRHIRLIENACRKAGFDGHVGTCLESTAAAMAYGLTLQETSQHATIMVVDMGGGTTDITIATKKSRDRESSPATDGDASQYSSYQVLVTQGDEALGGDDIDEAIMEYCINNVSLERRHLEGPQLRAKCREAKEALCQGEDPSASEAIRLDKTKHTVVIAQQTFDQILQPWLKQARELILQAKMELEEATGSSKIDEIVLVGGTTRIPAIQRLIQELFPTVELSTSLNPMSSVAHGLAIQAAIVSKQIPIHELRSALMLDCVPHAIGVELPGNNGFVEIIPRNTPLPAQGSTTFTLADKYQPGVTIRAVEQVGDNRFEPMSREDFSFLLRRLTPMELERANCRSIQVGMKVDVDGKFIVSVFDEKDPEQIRKV
jgi:molecular chaperone DnaK (HSP70)